MYTTHQKTKCILGFKCFLKVLLLLFRLFVFDYLILPIQMQYPNGQIIINPQVLIYE